MLLCDASAPIAALSFCRLCPTCRAYGLAYAIVYAIVVWCYALLCTVLAYGAMDSTSAPISALTFCRAVYYTELALPWTGFKIGAVQQQLSALGNPPPFLYLISAALRISKMCPFRHPRLFAIRRRTCGPLLLLPPPLHRLRAPRRCFRQRLRTHAPSRGT
eukprot:1376564-Rhodomonas_salina.1